MIKYITLFIIFLLLIAGGSYLWMQKGASIKMNILSQSQKTYPFRVVMEDKSSQDIQIYKGTWTHAGGNVADFHKRLQIIQNGKAQDLPLSDEKQASITGEALFQLPAGSYFVYIPNPVYEDDVPLDFSIPTQTVVTISGERH